MAIYKVIDRETIASIASSTGLTAAKLTSRVTYAVLQVLGGDARYTVNGTAPTTSLGMRALEDVPFEVWGDKALADLRFIDDGGTATVEVVYMGV